MKDDRLYLIHVRECIVRVEQYTQSGKKLSLPIQRVRMRCFEFCKPWPSPPQRISDGLKAGHPDVNWRNISAFRNVIVHGYLSIDLGRIWDIVEKDLPDLKAKIEAISRKLEKNP